MYPYPVIILGSTESLPGLEQALTECAARLEGRYADLRSVRAARTAMSEPALYLVRLGCEEDLQQLRLLSDAVPGQPIIGLVEGDCDTASLFRLNRAGATQLVSVPLAPADLTLALNRVARQFGRIPPLGRVVAVCGVNGGAGVSSLCVHLAHELATRWEKQCVLAEPAAPFGCLDGLLNAKMLRPTEDLYHGRGTPDLAGVQNALTTVGERIKLLAAPPAVLPARPSSAGRLGAVVDATRHLADAVLLDLPRHFDAPCLELIDRADEVVFVSDASVPSLQTLKQVLEALSHRAGAGRIRAVVNKFVAANGPEPARLCEMFGLEKVWTIANDLHAFSAAFTGGVSLREVTPNSAALADIDRLARGLFGPPIVLDLPRTVFHRLLRS